MLGTYSKSKREFFNIFIFDSNTLLRRIYLDFED